jgi:hypothetical protein
MATGQFNYTPIRNTALALIKKFGGKVQSSILRVVEGSAADPTKPWRRGQPGVLEFKFTALVSTLPFPALGQPSSDGEATIIVPGDIITTGERFAPATLCGPPTITDRVQVGTVIYGILGVQDISGDETPIMFKLRCKPWPQIISAPQTPF